MINLETQFQGTDAVGSPIQVGCRNHCMSHKKKKRQHPQTVIMGELGQTLVLPLRTMFFPLAFISYCFPLLFPFVLRGPLG